MPISSNHRPHTFRRRLLPPLLLVLWGVLIYWFSDQPNLTLSSDDLIDFITRKSGHMFVYAVFSLLAYVTARDRLRSHAFSLLAATLLSFVYAVSDEWHQTFVEGRAGQMSDVGFDMAGVAIMLTLLHLKKRRTSKGTR